jgi:hypothetical protein
MTAYPGATLIVAPTATATVSGGTLSIDGATFRNQGTLTYTGGQILADKAALIDDPGTFTLNGSGNALDVYPSGPLPRLHITGTLRKSDASTTTVKIPVDNHGTVDVEAGALGIESLYDPQCSLTSPTGAWQAGGVLTFGMTPDQCLAPASLRTYGDGEIDIDSGTISTVTLDAPDGNIAINGGTLDLEGTSTASTLRNLKLFSGALTGSAELDICGSLYWTGGTMSGTGKTVLCPTNTGTIGGPTGGSVTLNRRWLVNRGDLTWSSGALQGLTGAIVSNVGTFRARSEAGAMDTGSGPELAALVNHGLLTKDQGSGTTRICFLRVNRPGSQTTVLSGSLSFCGSWNTRDNLQEDPNHCTLSTEGGEDLAPSGDEWLLILGATVDCDQPASFIRIRFFIEKVESTPSPPPPDWSCTNTQHCGPAFYSDNVNVVLGDRDCVTWEVKAYIEGGEEPEPVGDVACKEGVEKP